MAARSPVVAHEDDAPPRRADDGRRSPRAEFSMVALARPFETEDGVLPEGARGVVHEHSPDTASYLVEFDEPFFAVVGVPESALRDG